MVEPHRHEGVFIGRGKEDVLCTRNLVPGESVYGEKRISVEVSIISLYFLRQIWKYIPAYDSFGLIMPLRLTG